jgi:hypothetical protein
MDIGGVLNWDVDKLVDAMHMDKEDVIKYFKDGRRISFILERRICKEVLGGELPESEGAWFDLFDADGEKWEVRSVSAGGTYFCPSSMVGAGRNFDEDGFVKKLEGIKGYILADITKFPNVEYWSVSSWEVIGMYLEGKISRTTQVSRDKVIELTKPSLQLKLWDEQK